VEFRGRSVAALFTLWSPTGWRTREGLQIGDDETRITNLYGRLPRTHCTTYDAYLLARGRSTTAFYVFSGKVWGFGLNRRSLPVCR
jgi:hypothetical protein